MIMFKGSVFHLAPLRGFGGGVVILFMFKRLLSELALLRAAVGGY